MKKEQPDISRLPQWAQKHIADLQRERDVAVRELREWSDNQTESPVSISEFVCTGEQRGPSDFTRYVQTRQLDINWAGVHLSVMLREDSRMHDNCITLQWSPDDDSTGSVAFIPTSYQAASLVAKKNMR